jgi:hypothetical protein
MIKVNCFTNLDLSLREDWPKEMVAIPSVGHEIVSRCVHVGGFSLVLQVVAIRWKYNEFHHTYVPEIELGMTEWQKRIQPVSKDAAVGSMIAFYEWYAPKVGRTVGSFI